MKSMKATSLPCFTSKAFRLSTAVAVLTVISVASTRTAYWKKMKISRCCGPECRGDSRNIAEYYDEKYFQWQARKYVSSNCLSKEHHGKLRAKERNWDKFLNTRENETVADLGAGGGFVLSQLTVRRKIAIEFNDMARKYIMQRFPRIEVYKYPEDVPSNEIDFLFSIDVVEHMECPITELREVRRALKKNARITIGVKNEGVAFAQPARDVDIHQHFFTWTPQNLYNMVRAAGFKMQFISPAPDEMIKVFSTWTFKKHFRGGNTYFYLWAHALN